MRFLRLKPRGEAGVHPGSQAARPHAGEQGNRPRLRRGQGRHDGPTHTASLFPGDRALNETKKLVTSIEGNNINHKRITLTYPLINNAKNVNFLATGENKVEVIQKIIEGKNKNYPASLVKPNNGNLIYVLDDKAGKKII